MTHKMEKFEKLSEELLSIVRTIGEPLEGNCVTYHQSTDIAPQLVTKRENIFSVGELAKSRILEIGFNAGHSASLLLLASEKTNASLTIVDIGEHAYMKPCYDHLSATFPDRTRLFIGDSRDKLAELVARGE